MALLVVLVGAILSPERSWNLQGGNTQPQEVPTVTFTWSWSTANPPFYSIAITSMGSVTYKSFPNADQKTGTPYIIEFNASRAVRMRIFTLVEQLNFFRSKYSTVHNPNPHAVSKSLTYSAGPAQTSIIYTTAQSRHIGELADMFEGMDTTVNYRRLLETTHSGNSGALEADLRAIELRNRKKELVEPQILAPALRQVASDPSLPQPVRHNAQTILREVATP